MRWSRDTQALLGARLRTLVVLGLVFAVVAETPLRGVSGTALLAHPGRDGHGRREHAAAPGCARRAGVGCRGQAQERQARQGQAGQATTRTRQE